MSFPTGTPSFFRRWLIRVSVAADELLQGVMTERDCLLPRGARLLEATVYR